MVTNLYSIKIIKPVWLGDLTYSPIHTSIYIYIIAVLYYFYYFGTWSTRKSAHARLCGVLDIYPHEVPLPDAFFMHHHFQKRSRVTQFLLLSFFLVGSSQEKGRAKLGETSLTENLITLRALAWGKFHRGTKKKFSQKITEMLLLVSFSWWLPC